MKYFLIYTAARLGLFVVCGALIGVVVAQFVDDAGTVWIWALVGGAVVSSGLSLKLLQGPREAFARNVEERASRAAARFEEMKTAEDVD
ncbi:MAG: DUF4229 domain-containing protein [Marmoricola sp.]